MDVDVLEDAGVDDDVVLDVGDGEAAIDNLPLRHGHPVVVHLLLRELLVGVQGLGKI